jgi:hypothetical protein
MVELRPAPSSVAGARVEAARDRKPGEDAWLRLCKSARFWQYLREVQQVPPPVGEEEAKGWIKTKYNLESLGDLGEEQYRGLVAHYDSYRARG